jgi:acetolactate synthase-1/2/3 large subunit
MAVVTGAELVVRELRKAGVEKAFSLFGAHLNGIFQSCLDHGIPIVDTRHEVAAGHAAEGHARVRKELGVALVSAAGGMTNVITSMANAMMDRTPVLYLSGVSPKNREQTNTQQHDVDHVALAKPVTKWAYEVACIEHLPRIVAQAIRIATQAPRGPVMLNLPWELLTGTIEENDVPPVGVTTLRPAGLTDPDVRQILRMLSDAKRPVILLGSEAARRDSRSAVERLAQATGAPVFAEFEAATLLRDLPDALHGGLVQGLYGMADQAPDMVLMVGARFALYTGHGSGAMIPLGARIAQIDADARELGKLQAVEFGVVADAAPALEALAAAAEEGPAPDRATWQQTVRDHVARRYAVVAGDVTEKPGMLHPFRASEIVAEHIGKDVTVVADGALSFLWLSEVVAQPRPSALLFHSHFSSMGYGFAAAVGAQAGVRPGERVILVTGDGSVGYSLAEFDTAVRANLPLIVIVMNNRSWGSTLHFQEIVSGSNRITGNRLENGRYDQVAIALGAGGYFADSEESFREALRTALSKNEPACIDVRVDLEPIPPEEKVVLGMDPFTPSSEARVKI